MNWELILAIITLILGVGWGASYVALKDIVKNAKELEKEYKDGMSDGSLSDEELKEILPHLVTIITDLSQLYKTFINLIFKIIALFRKK